MRLDSRDYREITTRILLIQIIEILTERFLINKGNRYAGMACLSFSAFMYFLSNPLTQEARLNGPLVIKVTNKEQLIQNSRFHKISINWREFSMLVLMPQKNASIIHLPLTFFFNHFCFYRLKNALDPDLLLVPPRTDEQKKEHVKIKQFYDGFDLISISILVIDLFLFIQSTPYLY